MTQRRQLGQSGLKVSPIALGCWPLAGITSGGVDRESAIETIRAALDCGINHLDTAYAYGRDGESEKRIAAAIEGRRDEVILATKVGVYWKSETEIVRDGKPETLLRHTDESLKRLGLDRIDLLYFHAPDDSVPIAESAGAFKKMLDAGKAQAIGVSNLSVDQIKEFRTECPVAAEQSQYNMFQREIETDLLPWCREEQIAMVAYEPLAMGLLTGKFGADYRPPTDDWRGNSPLFAEDMFQKNLTVVDRLRSIAERLDATVTQLVIRWTVEQPGMTVALCGAKRPEQIRDTAGALDLEMDAATIDEINNILNS